MAATYNVHGTFGRSIKRAFQMRPQKAE